MGTGRRICCWPRRNQPELEIGGGPQDLPDGFRRGVGGLEVRVGAPGLLADTRQPGELPLQGVDLREVVADVVVAALLAGG